MLCGKKGAITSISGCLEALWIYGSKVVAEGQSKLETWPPSSPPASYTSETSASGPEPGLDGSRKHAHASPESEGCSDSLMNGCSRRLLQRQATWFLESSCEGGLARTVHCHKGLLQLRSFSSAAQLADEERTESENSISKRGIGRGRQHRKLYEPSDFSATQEAATSDSDSDSEAKTESVESTSSEARGPYKYLSLSAKVTRDIKACKTVDELVEFFRNTYIPLSHVHISATLYMLTRLTEGHKMNEPTRIVIRHVLSQLEAALGKADSWSLVGITWALVSLFSRHYTDDVETKSEAQAAFRQVAKLLEKGLQVQDERMKPLDYAQLGRIAWAAGNCHKLLGVEAEKEEGWGMRLLTGTVKHLKLMLPENSELCPPQTAAMVFLASSRVGLLDADLITMICAAMTPRVRSFSPSDCNQIVTSLANMARQLTVTQPDALDAFNAAVGPFLIVYIDSIDKLLCSAPRWSLALNLRALADLGYHCQRLLDRLPQRLGVSFDLPMNDALSVLYALASVAYESAHLIADLAQAVLKLNPQPADAVRALWAVTVVAASTEVPQTFMPRTAKPIPPLLLKELNALATVVKSFSLSEPVSRTLASQILYSDMFAKDRGHDYKLPILLLEKCKESFQELPMLSGKSATHERVEQTLARLLQEHGTMSTEGATWDNAIRADIMVKMHPKAPSIRNGVRIVSTLRDVAIKIDGPAEFLVEPRWRRRGQSVLTNMLLRTRVDLLVNLNQRDIEAMNDRALERHLLRCIPSIPEPPWSP